MSTNFWELLQQHQGDLTKSGRTVAEYLLQHAGEAQYLSISSLAKECCVAEATVFRFCRALGFEGYHEMRIALAQANATGVLVNQQEPAPDADTATLCEHASALFMTAINGTQNALSPQAVDQAVIAAVGALQGLLCVGKKVFLLRHFCQRGTHVHIIAQLPEAPAADVPYRAVRQRHRKAACTVIVHWQSVHSLSFHFKGRHSYIP